MLLTFGLLGAAIVAAWLPDVPLGTRWRWPPWQPLLGAALIAGATEGVLRWPALAFIAAIWIAAWASTRTSSRSAANAWTTVAALLALALATHRLPGFSPAVVAETIRLSADSAPMMLRAHFDKGAAGLILLVYCCHRVEQWRQWPSVVAIGFGIGVLTAAVVIALVASAGAVRFDPKLPAIAAAWMAINLLFTCVLEEAFFRGVLQERLSRVFTDRRRWRLAAIVLPAVLFGLVHFGGGPVLIVAATLAGVGYGIAYARSGRVEAAVLAHFTLNATHFFGFTYPYSVR